ncbi:hypothetical protein HMPREF9103_01064 [Lentilactobacillus parafarraginis F0439]|uniref:Uncharacterized protein n=1 Tax=Lentilactobacillus parafarraginis F0439 TaxID=797515 RepID=G9ZMW5_9LACO|nr:hypothetical protein HMPREF9103_01064 [Lentilactobacillus parafarraginis F0439]
MDLLKPPSRRISHSTIRGPALRDLSRHSLVIKVSEENFFSFF